MSKDEQSTDRDLDKYHDFTGLTVKKMNFGLWLVENRQKMIKLGEVCLIVICAGLFLYSSYSFVVYLTSSDPNAQFVSGDLPISPRNVASDLVTSQPLVLPSAGQYDLAIRLKNPNDKFVGTFQYCFRQDSTDLVCGSDFILPGSDKYILALAQDLPAGSSNVTFTISNMFWSRVNAHKIPNWSDYLTSHLTLPVTDINYTVNSGIGTSSVTTFSSLQFNLTNQTAYNYYSVPVNILLFNGSDLVGVNRYSINNLMSNEKRAVNLNWPGGLSGVSQAVIQPDVNIIDDSVYLKYSGQTAN
jgi:hypothetical protein